MESAAICSVERADKSTHGHLTRCQCGDLRRGQARCIGIDQGRQRAAGEAANLARRERSDLRVGQGREVAGIQTSDTTAGNAAISSVVNVARALGEKAAISLEAIALI